MFALPRSATVPPFTGVFSLSFLGFTARASKIETPMSNARRDTIITVPRAFPILSINAFVVVVQESSCVWSEHNRAFV